MTCITAARISATKPRPITTQRSLPFRVAAAAMNIIIKATLTANIGLANAASGVKVGLIVPCT